MSKMTIMFETPEDVKEFVNIVKDYPYDIDLERGRFVVDAKSILGIMNLGVQNEITLKAHTDVCEELRKELKQFIAA